MNLLPNGPDDGGIMVMEGSSKYYRELWKHFDHKRGPNGWNRHEQEFLDEDICKWIESKGCKWIKVCCEPGDLILWDSQTVHYGAMPSSTNDIFAAYVCYKPAIYVSEEARKLRADAFEKKLCTAHDPAIMRSFRVYPPDDHHSLQAAKTRPVLSKRDRQLAGLDIY